MSNGTQINVVTNTVEIRNANRRIDIVAPNTGTTIAVTQPTTRVVQVNVPGPQGVQGEAGAAADVASLNTFTGSIQTQVNGLSAATSSYVLNAVTASMLQPYVLNASTASFVTNAQTSSMTVLSASFASTASYINPTFISASAAASGFGSVPAETDPIFVAKSASLATTGSNVFNGNQYVIGVVTASLFKGDTEGTASWARNALTASAVDTLNQNVTIFGNLQVFGTASYTYVTASQLDVGTNFISVNVSEPGERFGGLKVYDSGSLSHQATASLAWDSLHDHWVYQNASGSTYSGGMLISGPRNTGSLGDEPELNRWFVTRGDGGDHINSTQIYSSGSVHQITGSLSVKGTNGSASISTDPVNGGAYLYEGGDIVGGINAVSVDAQSWTLRALGTNKVDWRNNRLQIGNNVITLDWGQRQTYDSNTSASIDWDQRKLYSINTNPSLNWDMKRLYDNSGTNSVHWGDRTLHDNVGNIVTDYSDTLNTQYYRYSRTYYGTSDQQEDFSSTANYAGVILTGVNLDSSVSLYDLVSFDSTKWIPTAHWKPTATQKLGIVVVDNGNNTGDVLVEGDIAVNTNNGGAGPYITDAELATKIYIGDSFIVGDGRMAKTPPDNMYLRSLGDIYYQNVNVDNRVYIMRFNPSNDYYLLS